MSGNSFGTLFKITTFGESHGVALGVVIDGVQPNVELSEADIQIELDRRAPGQSKVTTARKESDSCQILSGVFEGKTTGTPIAIVVFNKSIFIIYIIKFKVMEVELPQTRLPTQE